MSEKLRFLLSRLFRKTWWRCALFSLFAFLAVALSAVIGPSIPQSVAMQLGSESIDSLLGILASSMLTVAIFSATTMVASFSAVSNSATPRASQLLIEDSTVQNTLAAFIGAFLYSVIALVGLHAHVYGEGGRLVLFGFTLAILVFVVVVLLRWIDYLSVLGRLGETIRRVELATQQAMVQRLAKPWLGGRPQPDGARGRHAVQAPTTGFVQHVSMDLLQAQAKALETTLHVHVLPGAFVAPDTVIASADVPLDADAQQALRDAVLIGDGRTFDHDPRFGFVVMGEVAARAMSASINDPGTALGVMATALRTLGYWAQQTRAQPEEGRPVAFDRVSAPALRHGGMVEDVFEPLARYAAGSVEVGVALQRALRSVAALHPSLTPASARLSAYALERAAGAALCGSDMAALHAAAGADERPAHPGAGTQI